jgi:hypothetical protein
MNLELYGVLAQFRTPDELLGAIRALRNSGVSDLEAYSPYPIEGLSEALELPRNAVPMYTLAGGAIGGIGGYLMQWYAAVISFPVNIGGRPMHSWPMFVPVSFELTILAAALAAVLGMLIANGLPRLNHPVFAAPGFSLASRDRFFLCIRAARADFDAGQAKVRLSQFEPVSIVEVAA